MRFRPWIAVVLIVSLLFCGCGSNQTEATSAPTEDPTVEPETIATEPSTLPTRPPEEVLPEIETLIADIPNARAYIEDGMICVETCDETSTVTGSIAYDRFDGAAEAWQGVIDDSVALCVLMRATMDKEETAGPPAKVNVIDHRFENRSILTVVDGEVVEDSVAIELAKNPPMLPNAPYGKQDSTYRRSDSQGQTVWIPTNGGKKYHRTSDCSDMINPSKTTIENAKAQGFEPCKKCY